MKKILSLVLALAMLMSLCSFSLADAQTVSATVQGFGGDVTVTLTIDDGVLVNVEVTGENETQGVGTNAIDALPGNMVAANSVEVDAFSGATVTSTAILEAAAAALAESGAELKQVESTSEDNAYEDLYCDVLVIGTGAAGGAATVAAAEAGAKVIAIDKMPTYGGVSAMAGGGIGAPESSEQKKYGIEDTVEAYADLWIEYNHNQYYREDSGMDEDRIRFVIGTAADLIDWLEENGFEFGRPMSFDLIEGVDRFHYASNGRPTDLLYNRGVELGAEFMFNTKATALLTNDDGDVIGATVEKDGQSFNIYAAGVVLATGGFAANEEMLEKYTPVDASQLTYFTGSVSNTGDGILMAEAIGADVYEKGARLGMSYLVGDGSNSELSSLGGPWSQSPIVDKTGVRFLNEYCHSLNYPTLVYRQAAPYYCIYGTDNEQFAEILANNVNDPAVTTADTLEELAEKLGFDKEAFMNDIAVYNKAAETGVDEAFGARVDFMTFVTKEPYYAVEIRPQYTGTIGGLKTDTEARVLRPDGSVINHLYAAGEASNGALYDLVYMSGSSFMNALSMGRIAGTNAAEDASRDMETEILVIGGGGTGLVAAISAIENGADPSKIVIVEKTGVFGGTSATAGAVLTGPLTRFMKSTGYEYSEEEWVDEWMNNVAYYVDLVGTDPGYPEKARVENYIANICPSLDWLEDLGIVKWTYYRSMPDTDFVIPEAIVNEDGSQLFVGGYTMTNPMVERLQEAGADLRLNTAGTELIVEEGKVVGAVVTDGDGSYTIRANTGVVLATGGYSRDAELLNEYSPAYANWISFDTASVGDTGDGIKMARDIGAAMYENGAIISVGTSSPNAVAGGFANFMTVAQRMLVNSNAERFVNEGADYYTVSLRIDEQPENGLVWAIVGDNVEGIDALNDQVDDTVVFSADSLEALAEKIGVDQEALAKTVATYNADCATGTDGVFGKALTADMAIDGSKYYAFKVGVCMAGTIGGVKTDVDCHVLDTDGNVIEGLWAGGCVSNRSIMGYTYMHGAGFGYAIVSGRTIGQNIMGK